MLSLCHRTTGIAMALTISGVSITLLALPGDYATYLNMVKELHVGPLIIGTFKFLISFTATYHYLNGIRHLAYDWAKGFELKDSHASGYFVLALATLVSTGFVFFYWSGGNTNIIQRKTLQMLSVGYLFCKHFLKKSHVQKFYLYFSIFVETDLLLRDKGDLLRWHPVFGWPWSTVAMQHILP